jgi:hypothetical protein
VASRGQRFTLRVNSDVAAHAQREQFERALGIGLLPSSPTLRRVLRLTERTIDARGQHLIEPQLSLEGWSTRLPQERFAPAAVIAPYAGHDTQAPRRFEWNLIRI